MFQISYLEIINQFVCIKLLRLRYYQKSVVRGKGIIWIGKKF